MKISELSQSQLQLLEDSKWRNRNSKWRWVVWLSMGIYGTFALWYVAGRSKAPKAVISAALSSALFVLVFYFNSLSPHLTEAQRLALEGTSKVATPTENAMAATGMALIAFNIWMSFYLQKDWLLWVAGKNNAGSWVEDNFKVKTITTATVNTKNNTQRSTIDPIQFGDSSEFLASSATPSNPEINPQMIESSKLPEEINLNEASLDELKLLPAITGDRAEKILELRKENQFANFDEVRLALKLQPHEISKLEPLLVFPPIETKPQPGRILDI